MLIIMIGDACRDHSKYVTLSGEYGTGNDPCKYMHMYISATYSTMILCTL